MDYWRKKYLSQAIKSGKKIALIGIGNADAYLYYSKSDLEEIWDPYRLMMECKPGQYCVYDINRDAVNKARNLGIEAEVCDVSKDVLRDKYDYIFASDVIEHVYNLYGFMSNIVKSLIQKDDTFEIESSGIGMGGGGNCFYNSQRRLFSKLHIKSL